MKKILYLLIILSIYGCGIQRKTYCERKKAKVVRILKDCPNIIETAVIHDTITIVDTTTIYIEAPVDSTHIDSLLKSYCDALRLEAQTKPDSNNKVVPGRTQVVRDIIYKDRKHSKDGSYNLTDQKGRPVHLVINGNKMTIETENQVPIDVPTITLPCPDKETESSKALSLWPWFMLLAIICLIIGFILGYRRK